MWICGKKKSCEERKKKIIGQIHELKMVKQLGTQLSILELRKPLSCFVLRPKLGHRSLVCKSRNCRSGPGTGRHGSQGF